MAEEYEDIALSLPFSKKLTKAALKNGELDSRDKDLLMSELYELKNMWYMYSKKINSLLVILP